MNKNKGEKKQVMRRGEGGGVWGKTEDVVIVWGRGRTRKKKRKVTDVF